MADKVPIRGGFNGGSLTGLAQFASGDTLGVAHGGTGLATAAADQLLTGNGTSALTSESNLTFDGSTLTVAGAADVSGDLTAGTVNADGDTSAGDNAAIGYTATEGLILTGQGSTSDVTIKNDADATVISIPTGGTRVNIGDASTVSNSADGLVVNDGANAGMTIYSTGTSSGQMKLSLTNAEGADAGAAMIYSNSADALIFNVNGATERIRILSGGGITFNGDTATANALDDYEEGTWTPVWKFGGSGGTANTQTEHVAWYTKIGNMVTVWYRGALANSPSGSGSLVITGLPYTVKNTTNQYIGTGAWSNLIAFGDGITVGATPNSTALCRWKKYFRQQAQMLRM